MAQVTLAAGPHRTGRTRSRTLRAVREVRGVVETEAAVMVDGLPFRQLSVSCASNEEAMRLLALLAADDADNGPRVRGLAVELAQRAEGLSHAGGGEPRDLYARAAHAFARDSVTYVDDPQQVFRSADVTLSLGFGNCVNTARLVAALFALGGLPARIAGVRSPDGGITHACALGIVDPAAGWQWAEATVPALWGEEPHAAAARLGLAPPGRYPSAYFSPVVRAVVPVSVPCCRACASGGTAGRA